MVSKNIQSDGGIGKDFISFIAWSWLLMAAQRSEKRRFSHQNYRLCGISPGHKNEGGTSFDKWKNKTGAAKVVVLTYQMVGLFLVSVHLIMCKFRLFLIHAFCSSPFSFVHLSYSPLCLHSSQVILSIKEVNKRDHALGREGKGWSLENNTY